MADSFVADSFVPDVSARDSFTPDAVDSFSPDAPSGIIKRAPDSFTPDPVSSPSLIDQTILGGKALGKGLWSAAVDTAPQAVAQAIRGKNVSVSDTEATDKFIAEQSADAQQKALTKEEADTKVFGVKAGTLNEGASMLGYSAANMLPQAAAQLAGRKIGSAIGGMTGPASPILSPVLGAIGGQVAGATAGYHTAKRADMNNVLRQKRDALLKINPNMTEAEWSGVKSSIDAEVEKHGTAEGKWEAFGNAASLGIMKLVGKWTKGTGIGKKIAGVVGGIVVDAPIEVGSEALTQVDQANAEYAMGLREKPSGGFVEAVKEVGPVTLVTQGLTMGIGGGVRAVTPGGKKSGTPAPAAPAIPADAYNQALQNGATVEEAEAIARGVVLPSGTAETPVAPATPPAAPAIGVPFVAPDGTQSVRIGEPEPAPLPTAGGAIGPAPSGFDAMQRTAEQDARESAVNEALNPDNQPIPTRQAAILEPAIGKPKPISRPDAIPVPPAGGLIPRDASPVEAQGEKPIIAPPPTVEPVVPTAPADKVEGAGDAFPKRPTHISAISRRPLSDYSPALYRQMSQLELERILMLDQGLATQTLMMSNNPDLARSQGNKDNVLVEFDSAGLTGTPNTNKAGWEYLYDNGSAEFFVSNARNEPVKWIDHVKSFTIGKLDTSYAPEEYRGIERENRNIAIADQVRRLKGFESKANADGSVTFTKSKAAAPVAANPSTPAPEAVREQTETVKGGDTSIPDSIPLTDADASERRSLQRGMDDAKRKGDGDRYERLLDRWNELDAKIVAKAQLPTPPPTGTEKIREKLKGTPTEAPAKSPELMTPERVAELIGLSEGDLMPRITGKGKTLAITLPRMGKDKWARIKAKADKAGFEEGFSAEYGDGTIQPGLRMKEVATETKLPESMTQEERAASVTPEQYIEMALRQAQIGNDETGSLAERDRATVQGNAEEMHANLLSDMAKLRKPLNAKSVETYFDVVDGVAKIPVPFSRDPDIIYTREGDRYVFNPLSAAAPVAANQSTMTVLADGKPVGTAKTFQEASEKWAIIRQKAMSDGMSRDDVPGIELADDSGKVIGHVTWNGKVYEGPMQQAGSPKLIYDNAPAVESPAKSPELMTPEELVKQFDDGEMSGAEIYEALQAKTDRTEKEDKAISEYERGYAEYVKNGMRMDNFSEEYMIRELRKKAKKEKAPKASEVPQELQGPEKFKGMQGYHSDTIRAALRNNKPVNAAALDAYTSIKLPEGYTREGDRYVFNPLSSAAPVAANQSTPAPEAVRAPSKGGDTSLPKAPKPTHTAIYDGKEISSDNFKQASQRVQDNLKAGEHGYVRTPDGTLFEISREKKSAVRVKEMRTKNQRDIAMLEEQIAKAKYPNQRKVLGERLAELKGDANPDSNIADATRRKAEADAAAEAKKAAKARKPKRSAAVNLRDVVKNKVIELGGLAYNKVDPTTRKRPHYAEDKKLIHLFRPGGKNLSSMLNSLQRDKEIGEMFANWSEEDLRAHLQKKTEGQVTPESVEKAMDDWAETAAVDSDGESQLIDEDLDKLARQGRILESGTDVLYGDNPGAWLVLSVMKPTSIRNLDMDGLTYLIQNHSTAETRDVSEKEIRSLERSEQYDDEPTGENDTSRADEGGSASPKGNGTDNAGSTEIGGKDNRRAVQAKKAAVRPADDLFGQDEMPFNLVGDKVEPVSPPKPVEPESPPAPELFKVAKLTKTSDTVKTADQLVGVYGTPAKALEHIKAQMAAVDADPIQKKEFGAEQRAAAAQVIKELAGRKDAIADKRQAEMLSEALRWQGAHMNAEVEYSDRKDKRGQYGIASESGKSHLDEYLMKKFGIDRNAAHEITNDITARNLKADRAAKVDDFAGEKWADKTIADRAPARPVSKTEQLRGRATEAKPELSRDEESRQEANDNYVKVMENLASASDKDLRRAIGEAQRKTGYASMWPKSVQDSAKADADAMMAELKRRETKSTTVETESTPVEAPTAKADKVTPREGDEVTWLIRGGTETARDSVRKIYPAGGEFTEPYALVNYFGDKYVPLSKLTVIRSLKGEREASLKRRQAEDDANAKLNAAPIADDIGLKPKEIDALKTGKAPDGWTDATPKGSTNLRYKDADGNMWGVKADYKTKTITVNKEGVSGSQSFKVEPTAKAEEKPAPLAPGSRVKLGKQITPFEVLTKPDAEGFFDVKNVKTGEVQKNVTMEDIRHAAGGIGEENNNENDIQSEQQVRESRGASVSDNGAERLNLDNDNSRSQTLERIRRRASAGGYGPSNVAVRRITSGGGSTSWSDGEKARAIEARIKKEGYDFAPIGTEYNGFGVTLYEDMAVLSSGTRESAHELFHVLDSAGNETARLIRDVVSKRVSAKDISEYRYGMARNLGVSESLITDNVVIADIAADFYSANVDGKGFNRHGLEFFPDALKEFGIGDLSDLRHQSGTSLPRATLTEATDQIETIAKSGGMQVSGRLDEGDGTVSITKGKFTIEVKPYTGDAMGTNERILDEQGKVIGYRIGFNTETGAMDTIPHEILGHIAADTLTDAERLVIRKALGMDMKSWREVDEKFATQIGKDFANGVEHGTVGSYTRKVWDKIKAALSNVMKLRFGEAWGEIAKLPNELRAERIMGEVMRGERLEGSAGRVEGSVRNEKGDIPVESEIISDKEYRDKLRANYFKDGVKLGDSRQNPVIPMGLKLGQWRRDEAVLSHGREMSQLRLVDPNTLSLSESMVETNEQGRGWDAGRYAEWFKEGKAAPPIEVVETDKGTLRVSDGHRRVAAAKKNGVPVLAWVSPSMDIPADAKGKTSHYDGDSSKPIIKTGLTYEAMRDGTAKRTTPLSGEFSDTSIEYPENFPRYQREAPTDADGNKEDGNYDNGISITGDVETESPEMRNLREGLSRDYGKIAESYNVREVRVAGANAEAVERIAKAFGVNIKWFREGSDSSFSAEGWSPRTMAGQRTPTLFLRADATMPVLQVFGHELTHTIEKESWDTFAKFAKVMLDRTNPEAWERKFVERFKTEERAGIRGKTSDKSIQSEYFAEYIGEHFTDSDFWSRLNSKDPGLASKIGLYVSRLMQRISRMITEWAPSMDAHFLRDAGAVKDAAVAMLSEFAGRNTGSDNMLRNAAKNIESTLASIQHSADADGNRVVRGTKAYDADKREEYDLPPAVDQARRTWPQAHEEATTILARNPKAGIELVSLLAKHPRALTDTERVMLVIEKAQYERQADEHRAKALEHQASGATLLFDSEKTQAEIAQSYYEQIADVLKASGSESGRSLAAIKMSVDYEFQSLSTMLNRARAANGYKPLTDAQVAEVTKIHDQYKATIKQLETEIARMKEDGKNSDTDKVIERMKGEKKPADPEAVRQKTLDKISKKAGEGYGFVPPDQLGGLFQQLARYHVGLGVTGREALVEAVRKDVESILPYMTNRQVRDAISQYGKMSEMSQEDVDITLRELKRQMTGVSKIEDVMKGRPPLKSGMARDPISQESRALNRELHALMKKMGIQMTDPATQLKSSLDAIKTRLSNSIEDLTKAIATHEKITTNKDRVAYDAKATALKAERDALKAEYDLMFPREPITDAQRLIIAKKSAERSLEAWQAKVADAEKGVFPSKDAKPALTSPEIEAIKAKRDAAKAEFEELLELANPKPSPEVVALNRYKAEIARSIEKYEKQLASPDFTKKVKPERPLDAAGFAQLKKLNDLKAKWKEAKKKYELANASWTTRAASRAHAPFNMTRKLLSSMDLSATLRQGGFIVFGHPIRALDSFFPSLKSLVSEQATYEIDEEIKNRPNAKDYIAAKLFIAEHEGLERAEENYKSSGSAWERYADKMPGVKQTQRAYTTFLNKLRADSFDAMVQAMHHGQKPSLEEMQKIASYINIATGRGEMGKAAVAGQVLSDILWSPRLMVSRFQLLAGQPMMHGTAATRKLIALDYARFLCGMAAVYALGAMAGGEEEPDPRSADFGKIKFGNTRLDPLAGLAQVTVLVSRIISGSTKTQGGEIEKLAGPDAAFGSGIPGVIGRFLRNKLSPMVGTAINVAAGSNAVGEKTTPLSVARDMVSPLAFRDVQDIMIEHGIGPGTAIMMLSTLGIGAQNYATNEYKNSLKSMNIGKKELKEATTDAARLDILKARPYLRQQETISNISSQINRMEGIVKLMEENAKQAKTPEAKAVIDAEIAKINEKLKIPKQRVVDLIHGAK